MWYNISIVRDDKLLKKHRKKENMKSLEEVSKKDLKILEELRKGRKGRKDYTNFGSVIATLTIIIKIIFIILVILFAIAAFRFNYQRDINRINEYNNGTHAVDGGTWVYKDSSTYRMTTYYTYECDECGEILTINEIFLNE